MNKQTCKPAGLSSAGRIYKMLFKRKLTITKYISKAVINIGSSGLYKLTVNGSRVGSGPCRSYPEFAEYDPYDIKSHLKMGDNEIIVEVLHHNINTFHQLKTDPYFYADGNVDDIPLNTPGEWLAAQDKAEANDSPMFSFAIGPVQFRDERKGLTEWLPAVTAAAPAPTVKRNIPQLTERELTPEKMVINSIKNSYTLYSYTMVDTSSANNLDRANKVPESIISSWFYSPENQNVECTCWWGEYFVNGQPAEPEKNGEERQNITLKLNKGWNFFEAHSGYCHGKWEFALNVPDNAGLIINANQEKSHEETFNLYQHHGASAYVKKLSHPSESPFMNLCWARLKEPESSIPARKPRLITIDMGKLTLGRIFVELDAPEGTVVDMGYSEELKGDRVNYRKSVLVHAAEHWVTKSGRSRLESFNRRGFRYLEILIQDHSKEVKIVKTGVIENVYPYEHIGRFECSDKDFNTLWQYGARTLELCSEDVVTDCPWRERTLYGGDMLATLGTTLSVDRDLRLIKRCIDIFMQSFNPDTRWLQSMAPISRNRKPLYEYPMLTVICMEWYCCLYQDKKFRKKWQHVLKAMYNQFISIKTDAGLYEPPHPAFIMHHYPLNNKNSLAFNACGVKFLRSLAYLLDSKEAETKAEKLEKAISEHFYNKESGAFFDATENTEPVSCAGNAWNVLFTNCGKGHEQEIISLLKDKLEGFSPDNETGSVSTYNMFYLLGALYKLEAADVAEKAIRTVYAQTLQNPTGTMWEHSHQDKSLCHVWSSAPNYYLSTCTLGVRQDTADKIIIAPQSDSLTWARGVVPHVLGNVTVEWKIVNDTLKLSYTAPEGCEVIVSPKGRLAKLKLEVQNNQYIAA